MTLLVLAFLAAFLVVCGIGAIVAMIYAVAWSIVLCVKVFAVFLILAFLYDIFTMYKGGAIGNYDR